MGAFDSEFTSLVINLDYFIFREGVADVWIVLASKGRKVLLNKSAFHLLVSGSMRADTMGKSSK